MNRFHIKLIACLTMLVDHICMVFFPHHLSAGILRQTVGRIAFPLFAFLLCQGFIYTKNRKKYCLNLLISALISEVFFDLLFYNKLFYWRYQNVIFTLLIALILLMLLERTSGKLFLQLPLIVVFCAASALLFTDYGLYGVLACVIYYYTRHLEPWQSCALSCIPLILRYGTVGALLAVPVLIPYKKTGGRFSTPVKYAFYAFYPGHLAVLYAVSRILH